jgi:hypothetical protein|tara:strand:- start:3948 stop:5636 length:1689 start_codon:yes stop_codon:yes gene_type:complete
MDMIEVFKDTLYNELEGVKITFINMPLREDSKPNVPPEGPGILSAIVRKFGGEPSIIDLNAYRIIDKLSEKNGLSSGRHLTYKEVENMISRHLNNVGEQDVFALSGKITTLKWQEEVAKIVKNLQPDCFLVTGNGLATEIKRGLFNWIPELDGIARSEGDGIIFDICKDAKLIRDVGLTKALNSNKLSSAYIGEFENKHRFVYEGDRPSNLDDIPYAAIDLLESDPYGHNVLEDYIKVPVWGTEANNSSATPFVMERSLTTVSSRGCPYACAFCYRGAQGERNYGMRSAEHIAIQIKDYVDKYNLDFVGFPDDNFAVDKRRIDKMVPVFKEFGVDHIRWGTHTRMDEADDRAYKMAESGCIYIGFGAESADEYVLTKMQKGGFILKNGLVPTKVNGNTYKFPKTMMDAVKTAADAGIHGNCTWIMAYPGEELKHLKTSVAFILWQQQFWTKGYLSGTPDYERFKDGVNRKMFTATAYPGTEMWRVVRKDLKRHFDIEYDSFGDPVCDDNFHRYVLELDDATKILNNKNGDPVNFGDMPIDQFLQVREYVDSDQIDKILDMKE